MNAHASIAARTAVAAAGAIDLSGRAGRFSGNAFTLLPGQDREITFRPKDSDASPAFILRDLHSATYGAQ